MFLLADFQTGCIGVPNVLIYVHPIMHLNSISGSPVKMFICT